MPTASAWVCLATADTAVLLQRALPLVDQLFRMVCLSKSRVLLGQLQPQEHLQHHLLVPCSPQQLRRRSRLLQAVDG